MLVDRFRIATVSFLAFLLVWSSLIGPTPARHAAAAGDATLSLTPSASAVHPGDTFSVSVDLSLPANGHAVSAVTFRVSFDQNILAVKNVVPNSAFPTVVERLTTASNVGLSLSVGSDDSLAVLNSTNVATIQFEAKAGGDAKTSLHIAQAIASSIAKTDSPASNIIGQKPGTVVCIAADLDCSSAVFGDLDLSKSKSKFNGRVSALMTDFVPFSTLTLTWPDSRVLCTATADDAGNGICEFRTPLVPLGDYTVTATDSEGNQAIAPLRVIPRLLLNDYSGLAGATKRVYCYGFAPGESVRIFWYDTPTSYRVLKTIPIAVTGRGSTLFTVPATASIGAHLMRCQGAGHSATGTYTVTGVAAAGEPTATPSPTATLTPTSTPEPIIEPSPTGTPTATPSLTDIATPEPPPTDTPAVEPSPTDTPSPEQIPADNPPTPDMPSAVLPGRIK